MIDPGPSSHESGSQTGGNIQNVSHFRPHVPAYVEAQSLAADDF